MRIRRQYQLLAFFFERIIRIRQHVLSGCLPLPPCCRPDLVIDIFLSVGLSCKGLKSAKVLETAARSKRHETIVEGQKL